MRTLVVATQVAAPPTDVFAFFEGMNARRYRAWHPEAHRDFRYVEGERVETGTRAHVEEVLHGDLHAYDVRYTAVVPGHLVEFRLANPLWRFFLPKVRLEFRDSGEGCHFVQKLFLRSGPVGRRSERVRTQVADVEQHMAEECAFLREILETERLADIDAGAADRAVESSPQQVKVSHP